MNREIIIKLYQYFYQKTYHYPNFEFNPRKEELVTIDKFIEVLNIANELGQNWLFRYFAFQFEYWSKIKNKKFSGVFISYIIGEKAFYRFENRSEQSDFFIDEFIRNYRLNPDDIWGSKYYKKDLLNISIAEEIEKQRIFNNSLRLANCMIHTTMFNVRSEICMLCHKQILCKKIQQEKFPEIYKIRNEKTIRKVQGEIA
jgi:hypothetical protein